MCSTYALNLAFFFLFAFGGIWSIRATLSRPSTNPPTPLDFFLSPIGFYSFSSSLFHCVSGVFPLAAVPLFNTSLPKLTVYQMSFFICPLFVIIPFSPSCFEMRTPFLFGLLSCFHFYLSAPFPSLYAERFLLHVYFFISSEFPHAFTLFCHRAYIFA